MRVSYNWLKDYVDISVSAGELADKLTIAGLEVTSLTTAQEDSIMEIEVTPNRTDWLGMIGIAREIAAITGKKLKLPVYSALPKEADWTLPIQIQAKSLCSRYIGRIIRNVQVAPSPAWLVQRLEMMGVRAVNNLVDITNFCLLESGQSLHIFDLDKLQGPKIVVRAAREGEEIVTLDGVKRILDPSILVIADASAPQAVAGIMGGKDSEVSEATTNILLESAYFTPLNIHNASRKLGLVTQASYHFERGAEWENVYWTSRRATGLINDLAGGAEISCGRLMDTGTKPAGAKKIRLRYSRVQELLGVKIPPAQIKKSLERLDFSITRASKNSLTAQAPSFRMDVGSEADLVEEVARLYGYDKIPLSTASLCRTIGAEPISSAELETETRQALIRQILASLGLSEMLSYSLISRQSLEKLKWPADNIAAVGNPLSSEQEIMRPTLLAGMLNALQMNLNRNNTNLKLFELSRVYLEPATRSPLGEAEGSRGEKDISEVNNLCLALAGKDSDHWARKAGGYSFFDLKGIVETLLDKLGVKAFTWQQADTRPFVLGCCAYLYIEKELIGALGEVHKDVLQSFDIDCPVYAGELQVDKVIKYICLEKKFAPLARFPSMTRDVSLIVPFDLKSEQITAAVKKKGRELVADIVLFDQYLGGQIPPDCRGLSYSIEYRSQERTLTAEEVDKLHGEIRQALISELKAQVR
ncbi:MAG: phenylalanine--tRNA ligase subunit beta [Candidatus Omnitrophota bacterium]